MIKLYKKMIFAAIMLLIVQSGWAYDFSAVYNGNTFYYYISSNTAPYTVSVVWPNDTATTIWGTYAGYTKPSGAITIPSTVTNNGITYTVTYIGTAFALCDNITSVTIPNTVTGIGNAFYGCSGLTSISLPNSLTTIGDGAFQNCTGLTSVTIPNRVTSIGNNAFGECNSLATLTIGVSVNNIGTDAFAYDTSLTTVYYNATACSSCSWTDHPFNGCLNFRTIVIGSNVQQIPSDVFSSCSSLTKTDYTGTIAQWCNIDFMDNPINYSRNLYINNQLVTNLVIPNTVNTIKQKAFWGDTCITSVTIPNSVTNIGAAAFSGCIGLTSVTIPNSVTNIGNTTFQGCSSLTSVTIPNSVTNIGYNAFQGCYSLTSVTIPRYVQSIGNCAFGGCRGMTSITFRGYTIISDTAFFYGIFGIVDSSITSITVYIPCNSLSWYISHLLLFNNFVETIPYSYSAISQEATMGTVSTITTPTCNDASWCIRAVPHSGYTFRRWSDGNTDNPRTLLVTQDTALVAYFSSGQGITETESGELILYPNPASEMVTITGISNEVNVLVINAMGKVVRRLDNVGGTLTFSVGDLPKGIYFVRMGNAVRKLVVE